MKTVVRVLCTGCGANWFACPENKCPSCGAPVREGVSMDEHDDGRVTVKPDVTRATK